MNHLINKKEVMKKIIALSFILFALTSMYAVDMNCCGTSKKTSGDVLIGIQGRIESAMNRCFMLNSVSPLDSLSGSLDGLDKRNNLVQYWKAYVDYYKSVFYMKLGNRVESEKVIKEASAALNNSTDKTSEDYALLALIQSFSIQFASGMEAGKISSEIRRNAEKAVELDSANARGWYVLGSNDYYTPASFGGGSKVEYYLKKAISAVSKNEDASCHPTWGREYAYGLLIRYYIQNGKTEEAKACLSEAEEEYPDSYFLSGYKKKLGL